IVVQPGSVSTRPPLPPAPAYPRRAREPRNAQTARTHADVVSAAGRADLIKANVSQNACSCNRRASPQERDNANASDAGAKQSRSQRRGHRGALLLADNLGHAPVPRRRACSRLEAVARLRGTRRSRRSRARPATDDASASLVAKPIARFTPGASAKAIVPGIGGPSTTARFRIKLEPCGSS